MVSSSSGVPSSGESAVAAFIGWVGEGSGAPSPFFPPRLFLFLETLFMCALAFLTALPLALASFLETAGLRISLVGMAAFHRLTKEWR
eukprot:16379970-Heterocapsa_arctica.AAC.1